MAKSSSAASTQSSSTDQPIPFQTLADLFQHPESSRQLPLSQTIELLLRGGLFTLEQDGSTAAVMILQQAAGSCPLVSIRNSAITSLTRLACTGNQSAGDSLYSLAVHENVLVARTAILTHSIKTNQDLLEAVFLLLIGHIAEFRAFDPEYHLLTRFFLEQSSFELQDRLLVVADAEGLKSWGLIARVGRQADAANVTPLLTQFNSFPQAERKLTLEILSKSARAGSIEAREAICRLFIDFEYLPARDLAISEGYLPVSPVQIALFHFLAEQWQIYEYLDFNRSLLASAYESADIHLRKRILYLSRYSGRTEWMDGLSTSSRQRWLWDMNDADWESAIKNLTSSGHYAHLWRLAQVAAPIWSAHILTGLLSAGWSPDRLDDLDGFHRLEELASQVEHFPPPIFHLQSWPSPSPDIACLALSADGSYLAVGGSNSTIHLWGIFKSPSPLPPLIGSAAQSRALAFCPTGDYLAVANGDNAIRAFRVSDGKMIKAMEGHTGLVRALSFSPDGRYLFSASFDGTLRAWRFPQGPEVKRIEPGKTELFGLATSPDGQILITAGSDKRVRIFRWPDGDALWELSGHDHAITSLVTVPRGQLAATASRDGVIIIWNYIAGRVIARIEGDELITALAFHSNEQFILGATSQGNIGVWNVSTGKKFTNLPVHRGPISGLALSPDGLQIYSSSTDGTISSWDLQIFTWAHSPIGTNRSQTLTLVEQRLKQASQKPVERSWLQFLGELIRWRQRYDVELEESHQVISVGEFDIEL